MDSRKQFNALPSAIGPNDWPTVSALQAAPFAHPHNFALTARPERVARTSRQPWRVWGNSVSAMGANFTFSLLVAMEAHFSAVRAIYANGTGTAYTVDATAFASTTEPGDAFNTVGGSWVLGSCEGAGANNENVVVGSTVRPLTVPAGTALLPSYAFTDWVPLRSLPRTDGKQWPLLLCRSFSKAGISGGVNVNGWDSAAPGGFREVRTGYRNGDFATNPTVTNNLGTWGQVAPVALEVMTRAGFTFLVTGDSIAQGQSGTTGFWNYIQRACQELSTPHLPVVAIQMAQGGQNSATFSASARAGIDAFRPSAVFIPTYSPNDGGTSGMPATFARALATAEYARKRGTTPIFVTGAPQPIAGDAFLAAFLENRKRTLDLRTSGALVLDLHGLLADQRDPLNWLPGTTDDNLHPNNYGNDVAKEGSKTFIAGVISNS